MVGKTLIWMRIVMALLCMMVCGDMANAKVVYYDAQAFPVIGKACPDSLPRYSRFPEHFFTTVRQPLVALGRNSAGLAVRFRSNTTSFTMRWVNTDKVAMGHMSPTGIRGLDLYCWDEGKWRYVNSARPTEGDTCKWQMASNMEGTMREYMLYLPLYDGVKTLDIGIDSAAVIEKPLLDRPVSKKPMVFYGSSIMQGGCASRPGMVATSIISRRLNREAINLGFSGNAFLDMEIAHLMAAVDASVYVMDNVPNSSVEKIHERTAAFVGILRASHPQVPIIFVEDPKFPVAAFNLKTRAEVERKNAALKEEYAKLKASGMTNIYYVGTDEISVADNEASVDGIHFTDIAFVHYADALTSLLQQILNHK